MPRKTKAQLAAEAEEAALLAAESEESVGGSKEVDDLVALAAAGESDADDMDEEFDTSELVDADEAGDFEAFADDVVIECIKVGSLKGNDSGDRYIKLEWVVQEGPHEKAHIWDIVMLQGKGVGMGKKKLNQLGVPLSGLKRTHLFGLIVNARTRIQRDKSGEHDDKTVIKKYGARIAGAGTTTELPD